MAPRFRKYEIEYSLISSDTATPEYRPKPNVRQVPAHYFEHGVIAFTKPDEREIAMPPIEKIPYENGVHAWEFVIRHEMLHNDIHQAGGIQNERGINNHVAYTVGPKYGIDRFPFPSY